jgi:hypothetical protein
MKKAIEPKHFYLAVKRNYENVWRVIGEYDTQEQAETVLAEKRAYVGSFNYDNAELKVLTDVEARKQFGSDWVYHKIGEKPPAPVKAKRAARKPKAS